MAEYVRNCAGGVVFAGDDVFLLKNDKGEWIMPKGIIRDRRNAREVSNRIQWFAMRARNRRYRIAFEQGFLDGDYFAFDVAVRLLTHEQDREILRQAQKLVAASETTE